MAFANARRKVVHCVCSGPSEGKDMRTRPRIAIGIPRKREKQPSKEGRLVSEISERIMPEKTAKPTNANRESEN